jgi:multidrug resistance efflux pump
MSLGSDKQTDSQSDNQTDKKATNKSVTMKAELLQKIPEPLQLKVQELLVRFKAANKSTRYAIAGGSAVVVLGLLMMGGGNDGSNAEAVTFVARRGDLDITVLEGGALEALASQEIRSQVKGREGVKILSIVEEGYRVTDEDVAGGKILVELDTAQLIDEKLNQEIAVETAEASYIERKAQYEIQINQNMTELNDARQGMRFARLDFEKFLGANVVNEIISQLQIEERLAAAEAADLAALQSDRAELAARNAPAAAAAPTAANFGAEDIDSLPPQMQDRVRQLMEENGGQLPPEMLARMQRFAQGGFSPGQDRPAGGNSGFQGGDRARPQLADRGLPVTVERADVQAAEPVLRLEPVQSNTLNYNASLLMDESYMAIREKLSFSQYADMARLEDGEAKQRLRSMQDDLQVAQEEYLLAQDRIEGQRRLEDRGFITPTELEAEELNLNKAFNKEQEKETDLKLYIQYTFPKDAEELLSDYENAVMSYQRQVKENVAEEAQERARFSASERKFNLERVKLAEINQQIELATIRAQRPGLVVYGASDQNSMRFRSNNQEAIQEGATVRERQSILTIPDMREMAVKVNIHESSVQRVGVGQSVNVRIDAFPDARLTGVVTKVAVVADSANSFMNPDLKVYPTTIKIDGTYDWLRPGMSAEVEILVDRLEDVVYVPVQAVTYFDDKRVVYVSRGGRAERREVEVGTFSDSFIEISSGIEQGEQVLLLPPQQQMNELSGD